MTQSNDKPRTSVFVIGVDPGATTGIIVLDPHRKVVPYVWSGGILDALGQIQFLKDRVPMSVVIVEDPRLNRPVFHRQDVKDRKKAARLARNVGSNQRDASILIDAFKRADFPVFTYQPRRSKWKDADIVAILGESLSPYNNEHVRDAFRAAWCERFRAYVTADPGEVAGIKEDGRAKKPPRKRGKKVT